MSKKTGFQFLLCALLITTSYAKSIKEIIIDKSIGNIYRMKDNLSSQCISILLPVIHVIEESHQLFIDDKPLDAVLKNVEILHDILPAYENSGCNLSYVTSNMSHPLYMWYYQDLTKQFEKKTRYSTPTDFEKFQLVNVANSISNKIDAMCQTVSCDEYPKVVKGYAEKISSEMLLDSPDYYEILHNAMQVKSQINFAFYHHKIRDQRYYQTLYWVLGNSDYLYKIPKKYLFDLYQLQDFRHVIASTFVNYLMQYNNVDDLNFVVLASNHAAISNSANDKNIHVLLDSSRTLFSKYYSNSYYKEINDRSANEFMTYIVNWFNNETYGYFKAYYAEQMNRFSRAKP